ncbi:MAG: HD domain-containing protein [Nanobdellota archaeon]
MDEEHLIEKTKAYAKDKLSGEGSGHDWWHTYRVWKTSIRLGKEEKADLFTIQLAALLHDISDWKFNDGDTDAGPRIAGEFLEGLDVDKKIIKDVKEIIRDMSFKGAKVSSPMRTKEGEVVQDADRLDAIGAIGIGRTFAYGGNKGREMYNPETEPKEHGSFEEYKKNEGTTINHFYEKLLLLKDRMNTKSAKEMAEKRHMFMKEFLDRFFLEWEGKE